MQCILVLCTDRYCIYVQVSYMHHIKIFEDKVLYIYIFKEKKNQKPPFFGTLILKKTKKIKKNSSVALESISLLHSQHFPHFLFFCFCFLFFYFFIFVPCLSLCFIFPHFLPLNETLFVFFFSLFFFFYMQF